VIVDEVQEVSGRGGKDGEGVEYNKRCMYVVCTLFSCRLTVN